MQRPLLCDDLGDPDANRPAASLSNNILGAKEAKKKKKNAKIAKKRKKEKNAKKKEEWVGECRQIS